MILREIIISIIGGTILTVSIYAISSQAAVFAVPCRGMGVSGPSLPFSTPVTYCWSRSVTKSHAR